MNTVLLPQKFANEMSFDNDLLANILRYDFSREKKYLINRWGKESGLVEKMEIEFKRFMFLKIAYRKEKLPISFGVDDFWHAAVLNTRNYKKFCFEFAGEFIHHGPTIDDAENWKLMPDYLCYTIPLYKKHFGHPDPKFWATDFTKGACCIC